MTAPLLTVRPADAEAYFPAGSPDDVVLDLDRLIVSRLLVQANSGGGKSHALRYLLEQTQGRVQHVIIDREGEFATLRERFPYLLVGPGGEAAADVRGAKLLARKVMELGVSVVLDLSELSLGLQREYVARFVEAVNHLPRALWHDCLIVIDEAHLFAPEKGKGESVAREAIAMLLSIGRKRGYCTVLATQRLSKLDKDAAAECLNKLIGRTSEEDVRRAGDELGFDRAAARELRALEPGTFWTYGPAIGAEPVLVRTGKVATQPPPRGAQRTAPPTPEAIARIAGELADLPQQAAEEEATAAELRRRIASLGAELQRAKAAAPAPAVDEAELLRRVERGIADAAVQIRAEYDRRVTEAARLLQASLSGLRNQVAQVETDLRATLDGLLARVVPPPARLPAAAARGLPPRITKAAEYRSPTFRAEAPAPPARRAPSGATMALPQGERAVLTAIAQYGEDGVTRDQLGVLTGYKRSSRNTYISRLQQAGLVEVRGDSVLATDAGIGTLGPDFEPLPTGDALREYWLGRLPEGERRVLEVLLHAYPDAVDRESIDDETGYKRSSRNTYISRLVTRRLVESVRDASGGGAVRASATLFDE